MNHALGFKNKSEINVLIDFSGINENEKILCGAGVSKKNEISLHLLCRVVHLILMWKVENIV